MSISIGQVAPSRTYTADDKRKAAAAKIATMPDAVVSMLYVAYTRQIVPPGIDEEIKDINAVGDIIVAEMRRRGLPVMESSPSVPVATPAAPPRSTVTTQEMGRSLIPISTVEQFKAKNAPLQVASAATAAQPMKLSTNMMLGLGVAALAGFYFWKRRS